MTSLFLCPVASRNFHGLCFSSLPRRSHLLRTQCLQVARATADTDKVASTSAAPPSPAPPPPPTEQSNTPGYIKTDAAGVTVIDVVEPRQYVAEGPSSSTTLAVAGAALALAGAAAALFFLAANPVQPPTEPSGPSLSEYIQKFQAEAEAPSTTTSILEFAPAAAPLPEAEAASEEVTVQPVTVSPAVVVEELSPAAEAEAAAEAAPEVVEAEAAAEAAPLLAEPEAVEELTPTVEAEDVLVVSGVEEAAVAPAEAAVEVLAEEGEEAGGPVVAGDAAAEAGAGAAGAAAGGEDGAGLVELVAEQEVVSV